MPKASCTKPSDSASKDTAVFGQVIRPALSRWLAASFRLKQGVSHATNESGTSVGPHKAGIATQASLHQQCDVEKLHDRIRAVEADQAGCIEAARSLAIRVERTKARCRQARERLLANSESVPESNAENLSMLQESFNNVSQSLRLLEQLHSKLLSRIEHLKDTQAALSSSVKESVVVVPLVDRDDTLDDGFKRAA